MTVSYYNEASNPGPLYLLRLFIRFWKGSLIKLIGIEILIFIILYYGVALLYTYGLNKHYIIYVKYYCIMPWNLRGMQLIGAHWRSSDPVQRLVRRTIGRYFSASFAWSLSVLSPQLLTKIPNKEAMLEKGILMPHEVKEIYKISFVHAQPFVPLSWACALISKAYQNGMLESKNGYITIIQEISAFQRKLVTVFIMDRINYSLVYVQVVVLSVYMYALCCVVGRQNINSQLSDNSVKDISYSSLLPPILTICELTVYLALSKLSMSLQNPLGLDDDDFDVIEVFECNRVLAKPYQDGNDINDQIDVFMDKYYQTITVVLPQNKNTKRLMRRCGDYLGSQYTLRQQELVKLKMIEPTVLVDPEIGSVSVEY